MFYQLLPEVFADQAWAFHIMVSSFPEKKLGKSNDEMWTFLEGEEPSKLI
jgi:hypothetical protein